MIFKKTNTIKYIVDDADWVIKSEGEYITKYLKHIYNLNIEIAKKIDFKKSILHFGTSWPYISGAYKEIDKSNKVILTWYHVAPEQLEIKDKIPEIIKNVDFVHTASSTEFKQLVKLGVPKEKIKVVPIGIELKYFKVLTNEEKEQKKIKLGIPNSTIVIGSFQKDGNGWGEGNEPKLIKGPDIFCDTVEILAKNYNIFVILSGPARGYVKNRLTEANIPFKHFLFERPEDAWQLFNILDLYIISSREEGGPKAITESMASGVALVSTPVGMAPDVIVNNVNGIMIDTFDAKDLARAAKSIIDNKKIRETIIANGIKTAEDYSWDKIAKQYFEKIYSKLV